MAKRTENEKKDEYDRVDVDNLRFDEENPRLIEYLDDAKPTQEKLLTVLWQHMAVDELAMSISASGYFDYEPVFVIDGPSKGKYTVIEGNRRLAAVKILLDSTERERLKATDLPTPTPKVLQSIKRIPVLHTTRKDAWRYLGFKHVNGAAKWNSYSKAQYVSEVHTKFNVPLDVIAAQIGDKHNTVQRLYRAWMVVDQAEKAKVFKRENRYKKHFSFSHLYTGLDYDGIAAFVKLSDESAESKTPVPVSKHKALGEVFTWLFGDKSLDKQPIIESQNPHLRQLDEVLKNKAATDSLRAGLPLAVCLEVSLGDDRVFQNALVQAKEALQKAHGSMTTGYDGEESQLLLANTVYELALDLVEAMERKKTPRQRRREQRGSDK